MGRFLKNVAMIFGAGALCVLAFCLYLMGSMIILEAKETKNMRHLKSVFDHSENVEKYSIVRIHEDKGWANVWLKSGEFISISLFRENDIDTGWYITQFGSKKCEEGRFDIFSLARQLLGRPINGWEDVIDNSGDIMAGFNENL